MQLVSCVKLSTYMTTYLYVCFYVLQLVFF